ncbi:MAG: acetate--CoA ligase family protein [Candidatus Binatia bacterium]|jgi:succinyl-CoA synthetase beta subunit/citryl-CoA synthetase large subunit|nr:acetate--CoA ligase family protein [Candidatus Binatia bacterium]
MRLYEHEAKKILQAWKIPIPRGKVVSSAEEIEITVPAVLKAQVLTGGRQKSGGIAFVQNNRETRNRAEGLLSSQVRDQPVEQVLVEERIEIDREYFLGIIYHSARKIPLALFSQQGGIDVEEAALKRPGGVFRRSFDILDGFAEHQAREMLVEAGLKGRELLRISEMLCQLADLFLSLDATLVEVNPLARTQDGCYMALDCHLEIDDDALYRHPELENTYGIPKRKGGGRPATELEQKAAVIDSLDHRGVAGRVIEFPGNLALLIGGGGASLTAFDAIRRHGGRPANYCEIGGNPSVHKVKELTKLLLSRPGIEKIAVIMNVVSNTRVDMVARGVIKGVLDLEREPAQTIAIFRIPGAWEEEGFRVLEKYNVPYCDRHVSIDEAARRAVENA